MKGFKFSLFFSLLFLIILNSNSQIPLKSERSLPLDLKMPIGLATDSTKFWVGDLSSLKIYEIDKDKGLILNIYDSPTFQISSLAFDGKNLIILDDLEKVVVFFDLKSGLTLKTLQIEVENPQGVAFDGKNLFVIDGISSKIAVIDIDDGTTVKSFPAPNFGDKRAYFYGAFFKDGYLWIADRISDLIFQYDISRNYLINILKSSGPFTSGLVFIENNLILLDYEKRELQFTYLPKYGEVIRYNPRKEKITFGETYQNFGPGTIEELNINLAIPKNLDFQDIISEIQFEPQNFTIKTDQWDQKIANFTFTKIEPQQKVSAKFTLETILYNVTYFIAPHLSGTLKDIPPELKIYLKDDTKYDINNEIIKNTVKSVVGDEKNVYYIVRKIYHYIIDKIRYEMAGGWNPAPVILERGSGSCSEYTFLMISMLRALGVPARYAGSIVVRGDNASRDEVFHRWVEVFIPPFGWIPVDPSGGDSQSLIEQTKAFGSLDNRFLITTIGGGNSNYLGWNYNSYSTYIAKGKVKVLFRKIGDWEPLIK